MIAELASEALVDIAPCGIVTIADNGDIIYVNRYLCSLLGYAKSELEHKSIETFFTISTRIFYQTHFYPLIKLHKKAEEVFFTLKRKDEETVPVIAYASVTGDNICCVFVPVNQRKKYEEEILQAKKAAEDAIEKNETLLQLKNEVELQLAESERQTSLLKRFNEEYIQLNKIISHDLHEPIRKLMIHIDLLQESRDLTADNIQANLKKMMNFSSRLRELTVCLQQYVSIDTSNEQISAVDLNAVIRNVIDKVAAEEPAPAAVQIESLPKIEGYQSQIERLFNELIMNSYRFRHEERPLQITIRSTEMSYNIYKEILDKYKYVDFVRIELEDNGTGFSEEYSDYIFGLFKQLHLDKGGSGFGLALCKKIVERHQGSISARAFNDHTTFTILLPLKQPRQGFMASENISPVA